MSRRHAKEVYLPSNVIQENRTRLRRIKSETLKLSSQIDSTVYMPKPALFASVFSHHSKNRNVLKLGCVFWVIFIRKLFVLTKQWLGLQNLTIFWPGARRLTVKDDTTMAELKHCMLQWVSIVQDLYQKKTYAVAEDESGNKSGAEIRSLTKRLDNFESALLQVWLIFITHR